MLDTYILKIDRTIEKDNFDGLLSSVSEEKKERISRFHRFEDAQRSLLGDVLARYAICKRLGVKNKDLVFGVNEYGKPILIAPSRIHFNISHSGNWVACAIDESQVGIDVEEIKPISFKIAERFFSRDEYLALLSQPEKTQLKYFYMIWTLKESYIKAEGKGLSIPLNSFTVRIETNNINVIVGNKAREFYFYQSFLDSDVVYAICTLNNNANRIIYWNIENFLTEVKNTVFQYTLNHE